MEISHKGVSRGDAFIVNVFFLRLFCGGEGKNEKEILSGVGDAGRGGRMFGRDVSTHAPSGPVLI